MGNTHHVWIIEAGVLRTLNDYLGNKRSWNPMYAFGAFRTREVARKFAREKTENNMYNLYVKIDDENTSLPVVYRAKKYVQS